MNERQRAKNEQIPRRLSQIIEQMGQRPLAVASNVPAATVSRIRRHPDRVRLVQLLPIAAAAGYDLHLVPRGKGGGV